MVQELAEDLSRQGNEVTVAAGFPHHPYGRLYPGIEKGWVREENRNGYRVVRGWHLILPNPGIIPRSLVMASQAAAFLISGRHCFQPDVIISYGPPLIGPLVSSRLAKRSKAKLVTVIYDIYPDILLETGYRLNPMLIRLLERLEQSVYRRSDRIVVLSDGFRRTLVEGKGVASQKVSVIPVWLDSRDIQPLDRNNPWRQEMGIPPEKFVVLYAGTIGLVSGAEVVLEAAEQLDHYPEILFLFVGEGQVKEKLAQKAGSLGMKNVRFLPFQPRERLSEVQAVADVSLVTLASGRGRTSVPSKVLGYMAAARPVLAAVDADCDTAKLVMEARCGLTVTPGSAEDLSKGILNLYQDAEGREKMGRKGRAYFVEYLEKDRVLSQYTELIQRLF